VIRQHSATMSGLLNACKSLARSVLRQDCLLCGAASADEAVCDACAASLPLLPEHCPCCAMPSPRGELCGACLSRLPQFDSTVAAWVYGFPADCLIRAFKFNGRLQLAAWFARKLSEHIAARSDLIVALPLHPSRLAERGFNQSRELARHLARLTGTPMNRHGVSRIRATAAQTDLPPQSRAANVRDAFACDIDLSGKSIAVVDDVMTTGATLDEFARVLKRSGAVRVTNWVLARTLAPSTRR
jgi:ComF family protein